MNSSRGAIISLLGCSFPVKAKEQKSNKSQTLKVGSSLVWLRELLSDGQSGAKKQMCGNFGTTFNTFNHICPHFIRKKHSKNTKYHKVFCLVSSLNNFLPVILHKTNLQATFQQDVTFNKTKSNEYIISISLQQFYVNKSKHNLNYTPNDSRLHRRQASNIKGINPIC